MMHKAWCNIEEVPYNFSGSSIKFWGHTGWKIDVSNPIWVRLLGRSQLSNPSDLPCSRSNVKLQGHTAIKIVEFDPNWAFPDCNSSLNSPMAMKCCTKLETAKERCPIVFQGHPSNFKVTRYKTSPILTQIGRFRTIGRSQRSNPSDLPCSRSYVEFQGHTALKIVEFDPNRFRTVTPVWIHRWLWNVAQSLKQQRRDALLFSKVIHQISRSHGTKHHRFWPKLGVSGL